jgi:putative heme-binding domain-containing protein
MFGVGRALEEIRAVVLDEDSDIPQRSAALKVLIEARAPDLHGLCLTLLRTRDLAALAVSGLALSDDPAVAEVIVNAWQSFYATDRAAIMTTLVSRPAWAARTLDALAAGRIERASITPAHARQIRSLNEPALTRRLAETWGRLPGEDPAGGEGGTLATWQRRLTPAVLGRADLASGRSLFQARCAPCHKLNGEGGAVGPELTGAARDNLAYLLENILTPSATVADEYRLTTLTLTDGRVVAGVIRDRSTTSLTIQSLAGPSAVALAEVAKQETSATSLMPPGLLDDLTTRQARDLIGYLMKRD